MTETNLEHIKNSLVQITHYPWYWKENENVWQLFGGTEGHMQIIKAPKIGTDYAEYWPGTHDSYLISNAPEWISQLLTTLETQNLKMEIDAGFAKVVLAERNLAWHQLETQKEEIERLKFDGLAWKANANGENIRAEKAESQIESLKAITELAKVELKVILKEARVWGRDGIEMSVNRIQTEIERLQNGS